MVVSIFNHNPKPNYYKHATTLFLSVSIFLLYPLLVNGQYLHHQRRSDEHNTSPLYLGMAFAAGTIVIIVIFIIINLYCKSNPAGRVRAHDRPVRRPSIGLDPVVVESFPVFKYSEVAAHRADTGLLECAVCLSPFEVDDDEKLRLLPKCNHVFHVSCVDPWFKDHSTCPLCRANLVPKPDELTEPVSGQVAETVSNEVIEVNEVENNSNASEVRGDIEEGLNGKYKRWKSMGHVAEVKQVDEDGWKRFTLKLPEEKMKKLGEKCDKLKRTRSSF